MLNIFVHIFVMVNVFVWNINLRSITKTHKCLCTRTCFKHSEKQRQTITLVFLQFSRLTNTCSGTIESVNSLAQSVTCWIDDKSQICSDHNHKRDDKDRQNLSLTRDIQ